MAIYWVTVVIRASPFLWRHTKILQLQNRRHLTRPIARQEWPLNKPLVDGSGASTYFIQSAAWSLKRCALSLVLVQYCTTFPLYSMIILMMILLMMTSLSLFHIMDLIKAGYYEITFATHFSKSFIVLLPVGKINNWFMHHHVFIEIWSMREVWRAGKMRKNPRATLASWVLSKLPKCFMYWWTHSWCMKQYTVVLKRNSLCYVISVHNRNMKHAHTIEFDYANLPAML